MSAHNCELGCGRVVSGNKRWCMSCIEDMAAATVNAKEEENMDETTHIIMKFDSQNREDLYRADGMLIASRQGEVVRFGIEPKEAGNRFFLSAEYAAVWMRRLAGMEIVTRKGTFTLADAVERAEWAEPVIEERNAEHLIALPEGSPVQVYKH